MRPRFGFSILLLAAVLLAVIFWLRPARNTIPPQPLRGIWQMTNPPANTFTNQITGVVATSPVPSSTNPAIIESPLHKQLHTPEGFRKYVESHNHPIEFYAQVLDQHSNPVPGVRVMIGINQWSMPDPAVLRTGRKEIRLERTSNIDGRFEVRGESGDGFGIVFAPKGGYILSPRAPKGFGPSAGSIENPVIFRMWKLGGSAPLVSGSKFWGIIPDGRVYTIDFLKQTKVESSHVQGDVRITVDRPSEIPPRSGFNWSFSIEAIDGGLIQTTDDFMYLAPESGYQPRYQFAMSRTNTDWKSELDGLQFYFRSRNGQVYGRIRFDLIPDYNRESVFSVNWAINPNGSRNLQP